MLRRLLLTAFIKVVFSESMRLTLMLSMVVSGSFALFFSYYQPYAYREGNYLAAFASIVMVTVYAGKLPALWPSDTDINVQLFVELVPLRDILVGLMIAPLAIGAILLFHVDAFLWKWGANLYQVFTHVLFSAGRTTVNKSHAAVVASELKDAIAATARAGIEASEQLAHHQRRVGALCSIHEEMLLLALLALNAATKALTAHDRKHQYINAICASIHSFNETIRDVNEVLGRGDKLTWGNLLRIDSNAQEIHKSLYPTLSANEKLASDEARHCVGMDLGVKSFTARLMMHRHAGPPSMADIHLSYHATKVLLRPGFTMSAETESRVFDTSQQSRVDSGGGDKSRTRDGAEGKRQLDSVNPMVPMSTLHARGEQTMVGRDYSDNPLALTMVERDECSGSDDTLEIEV